MPPTLSQVFKAAPAVRKDIALKIVLGGPAGAGKTLSALMLAAGLVGVLEGEASWSDVEVLDTEDETAAYYFGTAHDMADGAGFIEVGAFMHTPFERPYSPDRYVQAIREAVTRGSKVLVVDSGSLEWAGDGGVLDIVRAAGNTPQAWGSTGTPKHLAFLNAVRRSPIPIVVCLRENTEYLISTVAGQTTVEKLGMKPQQREGFDYEVDLYLSLSQKTHAARASKDRTGLLQPMPPAIVTYRTGRMLANWAKSGQASVGSRDWVARRCAELRESRDADALKSLFETTVSQMAGFGLVEEFKAALRRAKDDAKARLGLAKG